METQQLEEALLAVEARQNNEEVSVIVRSVRRIIGRLSIYNDTAAMKDSMTCMKAIKAISN